MTSKALLTSLLLALTLLAPASAEAKRRASTLVFPMKAADYKKLMDGRIDKVLAAVDKKLDRAGVSSDRKKAIHKTFDEVAKEARDAIEKAAADGTVTEDEAKQVKPLVAGIRTKLRERLKADKGGKPSAPTAKAKSKPKSKAKSGGDKSGADKSDKPKAPPPG